jgi:hypothetical protein
MGLHGDEPCPAMEIGQVQGLGELPGQHRRCADVPGLAGFNHAMECLEGLLDRSHGIPAVDLVEVNVVRAQTPQALVNLTENRLRESPWALGSSFLMGK